MSEQEYRNTAVQTALWLCKHKIEIFPLNYGVKGAEFRWKEVCTSDPNAFIRSVKAGPFNLAMTFGPKSGVIDIEPDTDAAVEVIERLMAENGVKTMAYQSRRGTHRIFKWSPVFMHFGKAALKAHGLDIRYGTSDLAVYSVCPPSLHPDTKKHYYWLPGCAPWEVVPADLPDNVRDYCLANISGGKKGGMALDVDQTEDGYLPAVGGRHEYLLGFSKLLYCNLLMPTELCVELTRTVSQTIGSYTEEGRGEKELTNLFKGLHRPADPVKEMSAVISMATVNEVANEAFSRYNETNRPSDEDIPSHIFHPKLEEASQWARNAHLPRNLWLMTLLTATAAATGTATCIRASPHHPVTGTQIYAFGVGGSGTGKSRVLKALLAPFTDSEAVATDATPEALTSCLMRNPRGVMLELTEGKEFYKMLGRYSAKDDQGSDNSLFHKCWSGDRMRVQRQKLTYAIDNPHLVVSAAIQQLNLNMIPQNDVIDGLMQRMLPYPIGKVPKKTTKEALEAHAAFLIEWGVMVKRLRAVKVTLGNPTLTDLTKEVGKPVIPTTLTLTPQAQQVWEDYAALKRSDQIEAQWPDPEHPFRADLVRHAEYALRISDLLFYLDLCCEPEKWYDWKIEQLDHAWVGDNIARRSIDFMEWIWGHKQVLLEPIVEAAFSAASNGHLLKKSEGVSTKVEGYVRERKRRVETAAGEDWTIREYYTAIRLKKREAEKEVEMFMREKHVVMHDLKEGQRAIRYSFTDIE